MDQHDDLLAAALQAVTAVEEHKESQPIAAKSEKKLHADVPPIDDSFSDTDDFDLEISITSFDEIFNDAIKSVSTDLPPFPKSNDDVKSVSTDLPPFPEPDSESKASQNHKSTAENAASDNKPSAVRPSVQTVHVTPSTIRPKAASVRLLPAEPASVEPQTMPSNHVSSDTASAGKKTQHDASVKTPVSNSEIPKPIGFKSGTASKLFSPFKPLGKYGADVSAKSASVETKSEVSNKTADSGSAVETKSEVSNKTVDSASGAETKSEFSNKTADSASGAETKSEFSNKSVDSASGAETKSEVSAKTVDIESAGETKSEVSAKTVDSESAVETKSEVSAKTVDIESAVAETKSEVSVKTVDTESAGETKSVSETAVKGNTVKIVAAKSAEYERVSSPKVIAPKSVDSERVSSPKVIAPKSVDSERVSSPKVIASRPIIMPKATEFESDVSVKSVEPEPFVSPKVVAVEETIIIPDIPDPEASASVMSEKSMTATEPVAVSESVVAQQPSVSADVIAGYEAQIAELQSKLEEAAGVLEETYKRALELHNENEQLKAVQKQFNDRLIRVTADFDNYRKRVIRDQEQTRHQAEERIVLSFLPVMDNLARAIIHARQSQDYQQLLQGVEMTGKLYLSTLSKNGCVPYDSMGVEFDPVYHDVLQRVIDPDKPHNTIVQEHLKGYIMHDRVIRPALVVVAQHEGESEGGNV